MHPPFAFLFPLQNLSLAFPIERKGVPLPAYHPNLRWSDFGQDKHTYPVEVPRETN